MPDVILEMRNITKTFPGVKALNNVSFSVARGEIHALVGENGAGKSTLMNVLSGIYPYGTYQGEIYFQGKECRFRDITESEKVGLVIIHQELALIPFLSVAENLFLGNERAKNGVINWNESFSKTKELLCLGLIVFPFIWKLTILQLFFLNDGLFGSKSTSFGLESKYADC